MNKILLLVISLIMLAVGVILSITLLPKSQNNYTIPAPNNKLMNNSNNSNTMNLTKNTQSSQDITITIIYDNYPYQKELETDWGFACLIHGTEKTILFDTGTNGSILLANMEKLNIDLKEIDTVVLSHIHTDHTGGLNNFLEKNSNVTIYLPISFPRSFKDSVASYGATIVEIDESLKICPDVFSTGQLGTSIKEQSLIIETNKGPIVITGCAHPGIVEIVKKAKEVVNDDIYLVLGGFHLFDTNKSEIEKIISDFRDLKVSQAGPSHCSGDTARELFEQEYQKNYINIGVGSEIIIKN
jgi:7,8-dihydropterin-6-yl-methyl-4-(beta-D-ribofuranosyl)aminobenzene 5'-phosphate synthase